MSEPKEALETITNVGELDQWRRELTRTPRPYVNTHREDGPALGQDDGQNDTWNRTSGAVSATGSESGTEADDERPTFTRALPPSTIRLRKGLKTGEQDEGTLLTPSQLDEQERRLHGYFSRRGSIDEAEKERAAVRKRRFAEFVRRSSEVALMGGILLCVLCGRGVATTAWEWSKELAAHVVTIVILIMAYPIKLSIVDTRAAPSKLWSRFRVPASFDPATVLYPPLLPVLVALSVAPNNPAVVLPNIVLGLASLPQRLFPRSSRLGKINAVHWLVSIIPLIVSEHTDWPSKRTATTSYMLKAPFGLAPETLVSLYPLHHALMVPLHYLTTTSLLISELHLLSVALINLLLLAEEPQAVILKACLWIGGVSLFMTCGPLLHWNVTLARVPRWKLRRPGHTAEERKSLIDAVSNLINLQRAAGAFTLTDGPGSDADEDEPEISLKPSRSAKFFSDGKPKLSIAGLIMPSLKMNVFEPNSAIESRQSAHGSFAGSEEPAKIRPRRNTVPERDPPEILQRQPSVKTRKPPTKLLWCLQLTPEQALRRKWLFAGLTYLAILVIVMIPVREYVSRKALHDQEPIGWALGYLFGQIPLVRSVSDDLGLTGWIALPLKPSYWNDVTFATPLHADSIRDDFGPANVRLLLIAYWLAVLMVGLLTVFSLTAFVEVDTRRKVFHGVMVAMLLPATFVDPAYCALALALVLAVFLLLEVIRAGQVPPLGNAIGRFVAPYVDGRDLRGPVVVSHIFLLIGCAVPLWFSLASMTRAGEMPWQGWELKGNQREVAMVAGVICVGMGDAAASLIGRRYGRHKWIWVGGKSIEGSAAFAAAVTVGIMAAKAWQEFGAWADNNGNAEAMRYQTTLGFVLEWTFVLLKAGICACGASFMEAVLTGANDNVVVPMALWLLVKGMRL